VAARRAPADAGGASLSTLAGRLGVGFLVAAGCMLLTLDRRAGIEVALALGHMVAFEHAPESVAAALAAADDAMYAAKRDGKNRVIVHDVGGP
jgi:GGDEF domain-containing protein